MNTPLRQCRFTVEYDGTAYNGWQVQNNAPSVQAALERAASRLAGGVPVRVRGAGRTDAGVHARGQEAVADFPESLPVEKIPEAMNSRLPDDIAVVRASVADGFDPRRHCVLKQYSYSFTLGPVRPALGNRRSWHVKRPLDVAAMLDAARALVGEHDFTSFCNRELAGNDNRRLVDRSELTELEPDAQGRRRLLYRVEGRSFLYNQVRAMAGTLFGVGAGRFSVDDIARIFAARDRAAAGESAPAWGLCLEWVLYDGEKRPGDRMPL